MKTFYAVCLSALVAGHALAAKVKPAAAADAAAPAAGPEAQNIAVMNLDGKSGVETSQAELMSDILRTELYKTGRFTVMNREDMDSILKEIKYQQSGACDQTSCIVEMGQALGVERMVAGTVGLLGERYVINAKLINVATSKNEILVTEYLSKETAADPQDVFRRVALQLAGEKVGPAPALGIRPSSAGPKATGRFKRFVLGLHGGGAVGNLAANGFDENASNTGLGFSGGVGGLDLTYRMTRALSLTLAAGAGSLTGDVELQYNGGSPPPLNYHGEANLITGRFTLRARLGHAAVKPYLGAGLGFGRIKLGSQEMVGGMLILPEKKKLTYALPAVELGILIAAGSNYEISLGTAADMGSENPPIKVLNHLQIGFGFAF